VLGVDIMVVVSEDDGVEELCEYGVGIFRAGVDTDGGVLILDAGINDIMESGAVLILLSLKFFEDLLSEELLKQGFVMWVSVPYGIGQFLALRIGSSTVFCVCAAHF